MVLADSLIKKMIDEQQLVYLKDKKLTSADVHCKGSVFDLRLGNEFLIFDRHYAPTLDYKDLDKVLETAQRKIIVGDEDGIIIQPKEFMLGTTKEFVKIPRNITARLEGKSSYARLGLMVHVAASFIDPGFEGRLTLELFNVNNIPIRVYPDKRICQIALEYIDGAVDEAYGERELKKFYKQDDVKGSVLTYDAAKKKLFD